MFELTMRARQFNFQNLKTVDLYVFVFRTIDCVECGRFHLLSKVPMAVLFFVVGERVCGSVCG
jgi:hypothetical protein